MTYNPREFWEARAKDKGLGYVGPGGNLEKTAAQTQPLSRAIVDILGRADIHPWEPNEFDKLLDFGCGTGRFAQTFIDFADDYIGFDISPTGLDYARQMNPWFTFFGPAGDGYRIPLEDDAVDAVAAITVLHHIPDTEWYLWTSEIRRVLRPGGRIILIDNFYREEVACADHMFPRKPEALALALGCETVVGFEHVHPRCWCALLRHLGTDEVAG